MTPERFHTIVDVYGADPRRWPAPERADAQAWAARHTAEADAALTQAAGIDAWLARDTVEPPSLALAQRIAASAPVPAPARRRRPRATAWWSGAAVAGVGLVGALAGGFAVSFFVMTTTASQLQPESSYLTTSFGGSSADWSGE
jgi:hypothetical protein